MNKGAKILVIDDEKSIRKLLDINLSHEGYEVCLARSGKEGLSEYYNFRPDIVILDLGLSDMQGIDVLKAIRKKDATPVIILTVRESDQEKILLLDCGADDYLTKPFSSSELSARIRVALRHSLNLKDDPVFVSGDLKVNFNTRTVQVKDEVVKLTVTEFDLLKVLVQNSGKIVTQKQLLTQVWGASATGQSHYLRIYFAQLRKKLEKYSLSGIIVTEPGVGYRLCVTE